VESYQEKPSRTLEEYWAMARRRRWWLIPAMFLGWALTLGSTWFISPKYRSETLIIIEQQKVPEHYVVPNVAIDLQERLQSMTQQILSRTRLQGIIEKFQLYGNGQTPLNSEALVQRMRQDINIELVQAPGRPGELSAFTISYSAPSPTLAQQVTNRLSSLFIEENLRNRQQLSENTTQFLENQLEQARADLTAQEQRLRDYKSQYLGELPEQLQTNVQILSSLQTRLQAASEALDQANQQRLYLESLLGQYRALRAQTGRTGGASVSSPTLDEQLSKLKAELADISTRYTPNHPDVLRLKHQIEVTEKLKNRPDAEAKSRTSSETSGDLETAKSVADLQAISPMLQVEGQLKANQLEVANRQQQIRDLERQINAYQNRLNLTPIREQQLSNITRDHEQSRVNYESLLNKKMQSQMATNLEKRQEGEQFRIIDPPNFPLKPYWPNRFQFSLFGLGIGAFLGLGITLLMEFIDARIYREEDLREKDMQALLQAPILAGIPVIETATAQRQRRWYRRLETAFASLLVAVMPTITAFAYFRG
jgi:polysaccharide chain length determinant protein (PEP-CTERM system associated)